jgi:hypothetical protein
VLVQRATLCGLYNGVVNGDFDPISSADLDKRAGEFLVDDECLDTVWEFDASRQGEVAVAHGPHGGRAIRSLFDRNISRSTL